MIKNIAKPNQTNITTITVKSYYHTHTNIFRWASNNQPINQRLKIITIFIF